ncbi:MAG: amidohydrolase family protein [bacterium]
MTSKQVTYQEAAFGISVLETALGSMLQLVHSSKLSMAAMIDRLTVGPANVLGEKYADLASLQPGTPADIVIFDPDQEWTVDTSEFASKGKNTPLEGTTLKGRVVATIVAGNLVYEGPGLKIQEARGRT